MKTAAGAYPLTGTVRLKGCHRHGEKGDGVEGRILVDGKGGWTKHLGGPGREELVEFDLVVKKWSKARRHRDFRRMLEGDGVCDLRMRSNTESETLGR